MILRNINTEANVYFESKDEVICDFCGKKVPKGKIAHRSKVKSDIFIKESYDVCEDCLNSYILVELKKSIDSYLEKTKKHPEKYGKFSTKVGGEKISLKFFIIHIKYNNSYMVTCQTKISKENDNHVYENRCTFVIKNLDYLPEICYDKLFLKEIGENPDFEYKEIYAESNIKKKKKSKKERKEEGKKKEKKEIKWKSITGNRTGSCFKNCKKCKDKFCERGYTTKVKVSGKKSSKKKNDKEFLDETTKIIVDEATMNIAKRASWKHEVPAIDDMLNEDIPMENLKLEKENVGEEKNENE